jgi:hypothetical protein
MMSGTATMTSITAVMMPHFHLPKGFLLPTMKTSPEKRICDKCIFVSGLRQDGC